MARKRRFFNPRSMFAIHAWSGFKLGFLLLVVFASGTLATVSHELDWLTRAELRVPARQADYDFPAMLASLRDAFPHADIDLLSRPEASGYAAIARIDHPELGYRRVFVDPYNGKVLGHAHWYASFQRFLRDFHRYLFLPGYLGIYIVGAAAFLCLASLISSFWVYPKWWRGFFRFRAARSGSGGFWKELHKISGVWAMLFILVMAVTGVWYVIEYSASLAGQGHIFQFERPGLSEARMSELAPGTPRIGAAAAVAAARRELPDIRIGMVIPPGRAEAAYYITGQTGAVLVRDRASHVFIDPYDGSILRVQRASELGPVRRWVDTADPVHFGDFAGLWSKLPYFFFGSGMTILSATGMWLRWQRILRMYRRGAQKAAEARKAGMAGWKWATLVILLSSAVLGSVQMDRFSGDDAAWTGIGGTRVVTAAGPVEATLMQRTDQYFLSFRRPIFVDPKAHVIHLSDCGGAIIGLKDGVHALMPRLQAERTTIRCMVRSARVDARGDAALELLATSSPVSNASQ